MRPKPRSGARPRSVADPVTARMRAQRGLPVPLALVLTLLFLAIPLRDFIEAMSSNLGGYGAVDYDLYMGATRRWLDGGSFYEPYQLSGPYPITAGDILYPPVALIVFAPFVFLPAVLWWIVPLSVVCWVIWRLRPQPTLWPFMALCVAWPPTLVKMVTGNPVIWVVAAVALGTLYRWPYVGVLLKPSLFPFALLGIRSRRWWLALGAFVLACVPFGALWIAWLSTILNAEGGGLAYSAQEIPMLLLPLIAAIPLARLRRSSGTAARDTREASG